MTTAEAPGARPRRTAGWACAGGCCGGLILLVVAVAVVAVTLLHRGTEGALATAIADKVPAQSWQVVVPTFAPVKWWLGQPADLHAHGTGVHLGEQSFTLSQLDVDLLGLRVDRTRLQAKSNPIQSVQALRFEARMDPDALTLLMRTGSIVGEVADAGLTVLLQNGQVLLRSDRLPGVDRPATVTCVPQVVPPATVTLHVQDVNVDVPATGPMAALKRQIETGIRSVLGSALKIDLSRGGQYPLTLRSAAVQNGMLVLAGDVDPKVLTAAG